MRHPGEMAAERIPGGGRHPDGTTAGRNSRCDTLRWDGLCRTPQGDLLGVQRDFIFGNEVDNRARAGANGLVGTK